MKTAQGLTLLEVLIVLALLVLGASLALPLFCGCRQSAKRVACASNLSALGKAMFMYGYQPGNGLFPSLSSTNIPYDGDAQTSLNLLFQQYVNDGRVFSCASHPVALARLQTLRGFSQASNEWKVHAFTESDPSSYAYSPGHNQDQSQVIILADHKGTQQNSDNHGANVGQNCLAAGGDVEFRSTVANDAGLSARDDNDKREHFIDPDIFSPGGLPKHPELESYCR